MSYCVYRYDIPYTEELAAKLDANPDLKEHVLRRLPSDVEFERGADVAMLSYVGQSKNPDGRHTSGMDSLLGLLRCVLGVELPDKEILISGLTKRECLLREAHEIRTSMHAGMLNANVGVAFKDGSGYCGACGGLFISGMSHARCHSCRKKRVNRDSGVRRADPVYRAEELEANRQRRLDPEYKEKELVANRERTREYRSDPEYVEQENALARWRWANDAEFASRRRNDMRRHRARTRAGGTWPLPGLLE